MRAMQKSTVQSAHSSRLSFVIILQMILAILFISGCANRQAHSPEQLDADLNAKNQQIQNDPSLNPQQKNLAQVELQVRYGKLPPSALYQAEHPN